MNTMQHEQLFTNLTPAQAEIITAGVTTNLKAAYGLAKASVERSVSNLLRGDLFVKDILADGYSVRTTLQLKAANGSVFSQTASDNKGANGNGTHFRFIARFKNITQLRLMLYSPNPNQDPVTGPWVRL